MTRHTDAIEAEYLALCGIRPFSVDLLPEFAWRIRPATGDRPVPAWLLIHPDGHPVGEVPLLCTSTQWPEFGWLAYGHRRLEGWSACLQDAMIGCAEAAGAVVVRHG